MSAPELQTYVKRNSIRSQHGIVSSFVDLKLHVHQMVPAAKLITENIENFAELPQILIDEANRNGGKDNITVLLSQVKGDA